MKNPNLEIDTNSPCLVTGATGYVAGQLIQELLQLGVTVHATTRNPNQNGRVQHLRNLAEKSPGAISFFGADLLKEGSFAEAMQGCSVVFHLASPKASIVQNAKEELVDPAEMATQNILQQVCQTPSVKTVVMTSSTDAIYGDAYQYSKLLSEQTAWVMAGSQTRWKLVVLNPGTVLGPGLLYPPKSECFALIQNLLGGKRPTKRRSRRACWDVSLGVVDVRDVAKAHVVAAYSPNASGRHILVGHNTCLWDLISLLRRKYIQYPLPQRRVPKWYSWMVGPWKSPLLTRRYIANNVNVQVQLDNTKAVEELGMTFRPLDETVEEMAKQLVEAGGVPRRTRDGKIAEEEDDTSSSYIHVEGVGWEKQGLEYEDDRREVRSVDAGKSKNTKKPQLKRIVSI